jgi:hypothetical protein
MQPTRREVIQLLASLGFTAPAIADLVAQARHVLTAEELKHASAVLDRDLADDQVDVIRRALQRHLDQFQIVRDLEIDDGVEPALIFAARRA